MGHKYQLLTRGLIDTALRINCNTLLLSNCFASEFHVIYCVGLLEFKKRPLMFARVTRTVRRFLSSGA